MWGKNVPCPRATQHRLSRFFLIMITVGWGHQKLGGWASIPPLSGRCRSVLREGWESCPCCWATQYSLSHILARPQQGRATKSWEGGATSSVENGARESLVRADTSKVHGKVGALIPTPKSYNSVTDTTCAFPDLYTLDQAADSSAEYKLHRMGWQGIQRVGWLLILMPF